MPDVRVRVIELTDHILHSYDRKIGEFVAKQFKRSGECCSTDENCTGCTCYTLCCSGEC
jgi:pyruvate/2-oxoglutarate dehydrogenase complex dihydrolipoamide dehydrogenase (E3) component